MARHLRHAVSPLTAIVNTMRPPPSDERTAFTKSGSFSTGVYTVWSDEADDEDNVAWLRGLMDDLRQYSTGQFIPEADLTAPGARAADSYTPQVWARLQALRAQVDPQGRFASFLEPVSTPA
jgi:FAD/FMN-containing dehydrogenase